MNTKEIENVIKEIVEKMNFSVEAITISTPEDSKTTWFSVAVTEPYHFTKKEGEALSALNHLVRRLVEVDLERKGIDTADHNILIDIGDFQKKRIDNVKAIAHMMAERARYFKSNAEVEPMSAFDRRIVHEYVAGATDLQSESAGFGPSRHVVIKYVGEL